MKRLILLVLLSMLMVFALSACGGSTADPAVEEPSAAEPTAEVAAEEQPVVENLECTDALGCVEVAPGDPIQLASASGHLWAQHRIGLRFPMGCRTCP